MSMRRTAGALTRGAALGAVLRAQMVAAAEPARTLKIGINSLRMVGAGARKALEGLRNSKQPVGGLREKRFKSAIVTPVIARDHYFPDSVY